MRVLVEQSFDVTEGWLEKLGLTEKVGLHKLMGGLPKPEKDKPPKTPWYLEPEKPAILIGTQDMLLSRALDRGYAESRFHWPIDFGLLNNDCLWVYDEPQLMASGVSTSAQLAGLRDQLGTTGKCPSVWMSATLEPTWLNTVDFRGKFTADPLELTDADYAPGGQLHKRMTAVKTIRPLGLISSKDGKAVAKAVVAHHKEKTQTLVVLNTVDRAKAVYAELLKTYKQPGATKLLLVHSRFRPQERKKLNNDLQAKPPGDRIIVATQVVEAGVDISSRTLVTELAPWSSIVQRIGRCNRTGDDGPGEVYWIDLDDKSPPYETQDLQYARKQLVKFATRDDKGVSPKQLDDFKTAEEITLPFEHKHVLRRRDLLDLFDTAPDLSGNDIDIARFVRGDDPDTDVQVFWRVGPPSNDWDATETRRQAARRDELCNVPIGSFKNDFLDAGQIAYRFDYLDGEWRELKKKDVATVIPGQTFWVTADQGGYDPKFGWTPKSGKLADDLILLLPAEAPKSSRGRKDGFYDSEEWSHAEWRTIATHTNEVVLALEEILAPAAGLPLSDTDRALLRVAARWHDWGKRHAIFQSGLCHEIADPKQRLANPKLKTKELSKVSRPDAWKTCLDIAKAPAEFWQKYRRAITSERDVVAKRFRHELASALGVLKLQSAGVLLPDWSALPEGDRWLALYLIAAHHGKVRLSIRNMPDEAMPSQDGVRFACGVWDGDVLPAAALGNGVSAPETTIDLTPMELGGETSWTGNALALRDRLGPFRMAYLEAILRAADCRASASADEEEPNE